MEIEIKSPSHKLNLQSDEVRSTNRCCTSTGMIPGEKSIRTCNVPSERLEERQE